jgi:hypothetical protein
MVGGPQINEKSPTHIQVRLYKLEVDFLIDSVKKWTVQALAPQGDEMSLVLTLAIRTVDQRVVFPLLCGSHPYPCGSLTYRMSLKILLLRRGLVKGKVDFLLDWIIKKSLRSFYT